MNRQSSSEFECSLECRALTYDMNEFEEIERRVRELAPEQLAKFRASFIELDHLLWDRQIEADSQVGTLDKLVAQALAERASRKPA